MINRSGYVQKITRALSILSKHIELNASVNLLDLNVHSENFYRDFFNLAFNYKLENLNALDPNAKAIDLGDKNNRIAIQVTSTSTLKKTKTTVEGFIEKKRFADYDRLIIFNIVQASVHKEKTIGVQGVFTLNSSDDIWDCRTLARMLMDADLPTLKTLAEFIKNELHISEDEKAPKEVQTFLSLIAILSDDSHPGVGIGFIEKPDPDGKIYERFADHSEFLTSLYVDRYTIYGEILKIVRNQSDMGAVRIGKMGLYLKGYSDSVLTLNNGDPRAALQAMVDKFVLDLTQLDIEYDRGAIEFFLIEELTRCNVFPRSESYHV